MPTALLWRDLDGRDRVGRGMVFICEHFFTLALVFLTRVSIEI